MNSLCLMKDEERLNLLKEVRAMRGVVCVCSMRVRARERVGELIPTGGRQLTTLSD